MIPHDSLEELVLPRFQVNQELPGQSGTPGMVRSLTEKQHIVVSAWYYSSKIIWLFVDFKKSQCHAKNSNKPQQVLQKHLLKCLPSLMDGIAWDCVTACGTGKNMVIFFLVAVASGFL